MNPLNAVPVPLVTLAQHHFDTPATLADDGGGFVGGVRELMQLPSSGWLLTAGVIVFCVAMKSIVRIVQSVAQERTRREIAAFIAEGSMTLLKSGTNSRSC